MKNDTTIPSYVFDNALYESGLTCQGGVWEKCDGTDKEMMHRFAELIWISSKRDSALEELAKISQEMGEY